MINEHDQKMVTDAFRNHSLVMNAESKSWHVKNPTRSEYWFMVTWCPGSLTLSGDVGELTLTHYHAMPTWQEAVKWVSGADHGYLMQKSDKKRVFNEEETIKQIIYMADEHLNEYGDDSIWKKLAELTNFPASNHQDDREEIIETLPCGYFESPRDVYEFMDDADWTGSYTYEIGTYYQYEALQVWANAVSKGLAK